MATVAVRTKDEAGNGSTVVTTENFRSWKRKHGRNMAFVVQLPGADDDDDGGVLVCTLSEMRGLPNGQYQARLVRRCAIPEAAKKQLRGNDLWKSL